MRDKLSYSDAGKLGAIESAKGAHARKQNRIDEWNTNAKLCKFCQAPITYEKRLNDFCNQSCGASFNNKGVRKHGNEPTVCLNCGIKNKSSAAKFCSNSCQHCFEIESKKEKLIEAGIDTSYSHRAAKKYLIELHQGKCKICNLDKWMNKPMPLVLDHINGHSEDGTLSNLRVICNNCDALTNTYKSKSKNKGNGRAKRRQRYKDGKSY